jgi:hypothetical protein
MSHHTWPDGTAKSQQNAFDWRAIPKSTFRDDPAFRNNKPGPKGVQTRYQQDQSKAAIYDLRGTV